ncbi:MAG: 30S ribosomal protein S16 [Dehalococcoidia bacterium]|nr:30S ribosomal protein S16 [Dehalococcoidia bacterium]MDW8119045.1 30S ribosomal protein S16 [Chloroflexota bacterium]
MVRIRLRRVGKRHQPTYRIVVVDARNPRDGAYVEMIGLYNPRTDPPLYQVDAEKAKMWLQRGAQPSPAVARILTKLGIMESRSGHERSD